ncbi:MAG: hypothetical protein RL329_3306 [Bacteroidota bacterium]|jgi:uncharacterized protein (TIGR02646 family)
MKFIQKQASPIDFETWKAQKKQRASDLVKIRDLTALKLKERWDKLKSKPLIFNILRENLLQEQGYLCCYCQQKISLEAKTMVIEHLLPRVTEPTLLFEYNNLLASCLGGKQGDDEVTQQKYCDNHRSNKHLDITPLQIDCNQYFDYIEMDEGIKIIGLSAEAEHTIEILNLNASKLRRLRGAFVQTFLEDLNKEEANILLGKLKWQMDNTLAKPLTPFIQVLIRCLENFYKI